MDLIILPISVTNFQSFLMIGKGLVTQQAKPTDKENFSEYSGSSTLISPCARGLYMALCFCFSVNLRSRSVRGSATQVHWTKSALMHAQNDVHMK